MFLDSHITSTLDQPSPRATEGVRSSHIICLEHTVATSGFQDAKERNSFQVGFRSAGPRNAGPSECLAQSFAKLQG